MASPPPLNREGSLTECLRSWGREAAEVTLALSLTHKASCPHRHLVIISTGSPQFFVDMWNLSGLAGKVSTETTVVTSLWAAIPRASRHHPEAVG